MCFFPFLKKISQFDFNIAHRVFSIFCVTCIGQFSVAQLQSNEWIPLFDPQSLVEGELHGQVGWLTNGFTDVFQVRPDPVTGDNPVIHLSNHEVSASPFVWLQLPESIEGIGTLFYRQRIEPDASTTSTRQSWQIGLNSATKAEGRQRYDFNVRKEIDWSRHRAADDRDGHTNVIPFAWVNFWLVVDTNAGTLKIYRTRDTEVVTEDDLVSSGSFREATHELSHFKISRGNIERDWTTQFSHLYQSKGENLSLPSTVKKLDTEVSETLDRVQTGTWEHNDKEHPFRINIPKGLELGEETPVAVYLKNLPRPRIGTDGDEDLIAGILEQGLIVMEIDCRNFPSETPYLEATLFDFHRALRQLIPALTNGRTTVDERQLYTVPEGYRLLRDLPYWNIKKHGAHGSLERVLEVYNTTVAERFNVQPVETIEEMVGSEGQPFDYNLYIDIIYPSGKDVEAVPLIAHFSTIWPIAGTMRTGDRRKIVLGWLTSGYGLAYVDHVYNPPARTRYYGHFNPGFTLDVWNGVAAGSAAIRFFREFANYFNLNGQIGALGHSKSSYTVARIADPLHAELEEHETFSGFPPGSPEEQPWPGHDSSITVAYASMGMGTRRIQYFNERTVPMVLAVGYYDQFDHWQAFPQLIAHLEDLDHNHFALWMEELGHTFPGGIDRATGQKRALLLRAFFDQHLNPGNDHSLRLIGIIPADGADYVDIDGSSPIMFVEEDNLPQDLAGLSPTVPVTVRFARRIDLTSISQNSLQVLDSRDNSSVPGEWRVSLGQTRFEFLPEGQLSHDTLYTVFVSNEIRDVHGNSLNSDHKQSFTTRSP